MACRQAIMGGTKPLSDQVLEYYQLDLCKPTSLNINQNVYTFFQENAFKNVVWKPVALLARFQWVYC